MLGSLDIGSKFARSEGTAGYHVRGFAPLRVCNMILSSSGNRAFAAVWQQGSEFTVRGLIICEYKFVLNFVGT